MRIIQRLGLANTPGVVSLLAALLIDAIGTGLFMAFSLLYFTEVARLPLGQVGLALSIATMIGLAATPLGGVLIDRFGPKRVLLAGFVIQAVGYVGYLFVTSIPLLLLIAIPVTGGLRVFWVAFPVLVSELSDGADRDRWFAITGSAREAGIGLGGLMAGLVVGIGGHGAYRGLLLANAVSFAIAALLMARVPAEHTPLGAHEVKPSYREVLRDRPYLGMTVANTIFAFCAILSSVALPLYVVDRLHAPAWLVGVLLAIYTIVLAVGMPIVVDRARPYRRTRTLAVAALIYAVAFVLYLAALWVPAAWLPPYLIAVTLIFSLPDTTHGPTASALCAAAGPAHLRGRYLAMFSFAWGLAHALAPGLVAACFLLGSGGPWIFGFVIAIVAFTMMFKLEPHLPAEAVYTNIAPPVAAGFATPE